MPKAPPSEHAAEYERLSANLARIRSGELPHGQEQGILDMLRLLAPHVPDDERTKIRDAAGLTEGG